MCRCGSPTLKLIRENACATHWYEEEKYNVAHPELVLLVKFKLSLSLEEVMEIANSRADKFRALSGLKQK